MFFVAKSENRNQVHYGISLDGSCAPRGEAPVFAYWRMLERGPLASEPLLAREVPAYGFAEQRVLVRDDRGGRVRITLESATPKRPIVFETARRGDACVAMARATIGGSPAWLKSVFLAAPVAVGGRVHGSRGARQRERQARRRARLELSAPRADGRARVAGSLAPSALPDYGPIVNRRSAVELMLAFGAAALRRQADRRRETEVRATRSLRCWARRARRRGERPDVPEGLQRHSLDVMPSIFLAHGSPLLLDDRAAC